MDRSVTDRLGGLSVQDEPGRTVRADNFTLAVVVCRAKFQVDQGVAQSAATAVAGNGRLIDENGLFGFHEAVPLRRLKQQITYNPSRANFQSPHMFATSVFL